jgi:hypothetical protein
MPNAAVLALGVLAIVSVLVDVFYVIAPQAFRTKLSWNRLIARVAWPLWLALTSRIRDRRMRHAVLGVFAPSFLIFFLVFWVELLIFGYGCVFFALREHLEPVTSFGSAVYFAGVTLLTIGYGDILPTDAASRAVAIAAGVTGVGLFSLTTAFLFSLFASFRHREQFVIHLGARATRPSSGIALVERYARMGRLDDLAAVLSHSEPWMSSVVESHLAYPALVFFRTNDPDLSWVAAFVTLLDAAALLLTTVRGADRGSAENTLELGRYATRQFSLHFDPPLRSGISMERATFDRGFARLAAAGVELHDADEAWSHFSAMRSSYVAPLATLGRYLATHHGEWFEESSVMQPA